MGQVLESYQCIWRKKETSQEGGRRLKSGLKGFRGSRVRSELVLATTGSEKEEETVQVKEEA